MTTRTMSSGRRALLTAITGAALTVTAFAATVAAADAIPSGWHVHDGQGGLGSQHKGIGFFPTILQLSTSDYLADPARCPDATDKAFLPSFDNSESPLLRAGQCQTSTKVIHLRTVPLGTDGPAGWASITSASEPGYITYYRVTDR